MNPTFDDYDEFEFDEAMHRSRRSTARRLRREKELTDERKRPPRYSERWANSGLDDFDDEDEGDHDYLQFDDYDDDSLNRWR